MDQKADLFNACRMAFGFLTVLPVRQKSEWSDRDFGWSAAFYPLAGAVIGLAAGGVFMLLDRIFVRPLAAFLTLVCWILFSGGLHWDGLADCMDGFGCAAVPEKRLEIMKDPRLGTYGALGVFSALILKWLCLWHLPADAGLLCFALTGAAARWAMLFLLSLPLANPNGMAAMLKRSCPKKITLIAAPVPLILAALCFPRGLWIPALALGTAGLLGLIARKKIGGINGDVLGCCIETAEIVTLLALQVLP